MLFVPSADGPDDTPRTGAPPPASAFVLPEPPTATGLPDATFANLVRLARAVLGVPVAAVRLVDADGGQPAASDATIPETLWRQVVASARSHVVADARAHPSIGRDGGEATPPVGAFAGVPVRAPDGRVVGAFCALDAEPRAWSERELALLGEFAAAAGAEAARIDSVERTGEMAFLRGTIDALTAHLAVVAADGTIVAVNRAWRRFADANGLALPDHGVGANYLAIAGAAAGLDAENGPAVAAGIRAVLAGETAEFTLEYPCHEPQRRRWFVVRATPLAGPPEPHAVVAHEDITDRWSTEQALRESEHFLASVLDTAPTVLYVFDIPGGRARFMSDRAARALGVPVAELEAQDGEVLSRFMHADDRARFPQHLARLREADDGAIIENEYRMRHGDGQWRWFVSRDRVFARDEAGNPTQVLGIALDVSERRRSEAALRESEARFRTMANTTPMSIWATDAAGRMEFVNRTYAEFFGVDEEDARGLDWESLVHPDDAAAYAAAFRAALEARTPFRASTRVRRADGAWRWVESVGAPRFGPDGAFLGMVGSSPDVTERRVAEEERVTFLDAVAHDVKNPLAVVKGQAQFLRRRLERGDEDRARLLDGLAGIEAATDRAARLIEELLDVAHLRAGRALMLRRGPTDLVALARLLADAAQQSTTAHAIRVEANPEAVVGDWDAARIERVLDNLLSNAIKYSPAGGPVVVRVGQERRDGRDWGVLSVTDRGVGIPAADLPFLFERFRRGGNVGSFAGYGVGLSGARQIVEQHGGTLTVASEEGQGATFSVRLPRVARTER